MVMIFMLAFTMMLTMKIFWMMIILGGRRSIPPHGGAEIYFPICFIVRETGEDQHNITESHDTKLKEEKGNAPVLYILHKINYL